MLYHLGTNPPTLLKTLEASKSPVHQITCSSVSNLVAVGYASGEIELRDAKTLDSLSTTKASAGKINRLIFTATGDRLFSHSNERVSLWLLGSGKKLEESGLLWERPHDDITLAGPHEDLWCSQYKGPLAVYRTAAPESQTKANQDSFTISTMVTPDRLAEIAARLNELAPDWRLQLSSGDPISEGEITTALSDMGLDPGTRLNTSNTSALDAFLDLLSPDIPCGNSVTWSGGNRSGHAFKGIVSVICVEQPELYFDLSEEECKKIRSDFLTALQLAAPSLVTVLERRTKEWLGWPPPEGNVHLWLPYLYESPLRTRLTTLGLGVYDRIVAIDDRRIDNLDSLIQYLTEQSAQEIASGSTIRLYIKRGAFSQPVVQIH